MNIFLSYASEQRTIADDVCARLQAVGHEVFFDREDLPAGASYDDLIRRAIDDCDLLVFLVSPESVAKGHYTRTELKIASRKWPTAGWHVLPVLAAATPLDTIPAYLRALTILEAEGNLAAEVVLEVEDRVQEYGASTPARDGDEPPASDADTKADASTQSETRTDTTEQYGSLHIRFGRTAAGGYSIAVPESPVGERSSESCALDPAALERALWSGAVAIEGSARRAALPADATARLPSEADARKVGQALYEALFETPIGSCLQDGLRTIDAQRGEGLRFVLNTTDAPDLARLPWEFLYSPVNEDFLFSDRMKPIVRIFDVNEPPPTLSVEPPLRLLIAVSSPTDASDLHVGAEIAHLDRALSALASGGQVETLRLDHASLESLDDALLHFKPHVLHFIGHGDFSGDEGVLILESDTTPGAADKIGGRPLAVILRNHLGSLRLVFLNSCMGAAASTRDPFAGVAQSLIRRGIPAVIAMQFPIPDEAAIALARHFYRYLAAGQPVDAALTSARAFLYARGHAVEWGAPVLHMRTPNGRLFDLTGAAAPARPPAPAPVPQPIREATETPSTSIEPEELPAPPLSSLKAAPNRAALGALLMLGVSVLVLAVAATSWLFWGVSDEPTGTASLPSVDREQLPEAPPPRPEPSSTPSPKPVPAPQPGLADIEQALVELQSGDARRGLQILDALRAEDPSALSRERLGELHADLAYALADGIVGEAAAGNVEGALASDLIAQLDALAPFAPPVEAQLHRMLDPRAQSLPGFPSIDSLPPVSAGPVEFFVPDGMAWTGADGESGMLISVRRGDSLWRIAERLTGDGSSWPSLYAFHNRAAEAQGAELITDPNRILPGQRIIVPMTASSADDDLGQNGIDYYVSRGESLWRIARRIYGDPLAWPQILHDNAESIADPDLIHPGQKLLLTPLAAPAG